MLLRRISQEFIYVKMKYLNTTFNNLIGLKQKRTLVNLYKHIE